MLRSGWASLAASRISRARTVHDLLHLDPGVFAHAGQRDTDLIEDGELRNLEIPLGDLVERHALHVLR